MGRLQKNSKAKQEPTKKRGKAEKKEEVEEDLESDDDFEDCDDVEEEEDDKKDHDDEKQMKKKVSLYDLLDIQKDASIEEIVSQWKPGSRFWLLLVRNQPLACFSFAEQKKGYKQLALKIHPDKNLNDPEAKEKFQKVIEAYKILSDPAKKKIYDETGKQEESFILPTCLPAKY